MFAEPKIDTEWALAGQPAVIMENRVLRLVVLPGMGAKIISLIDKRTDTELLWRNPRIPIRPPAFGSGYDDQFLGGWDELFPNDVPEELAGEPMPDHGELWTLPWTPVAGADDEQVWLDLRVVGPVTGVEVAKRLTVAGDGRLVIAHRIHNPTRRALPFLWKSHVAVALHPDTTIEMAAREVLVDDFGSPRVRPPRGRFDWPLAGSDGTIHDFRRLPDTSDRGVTEFLLATSLERGECGVRHPSQGTGLTLTWDPAVLPSCWSFASYGGGWRGLNVLVLEPCTGHPLSVVDGVTAGTHQILPAGGSLEWRLTAEVGLKPVATG